MLGSYRRGSCEDSRHTFSGCFVLCWWSWWSKTTAWVSPWQERKHVLKFPQEAKTWKENEEKPNKLLIASQLLSMEDPVSKRSHRREQEALQRQVSSDNLGKEPLPWRREGIPTGCGQEVSLMWKKRKDLPRRDSNLCTPSKCQVCPFLRSPGMASLRARGKRRGRVISSTLWKSS